MKLFGVAGNPVFHSLSPQIHNRLLRKYSIEGAYTRLHAENASEIDTLIRDGVFCGMNVTSPFKQDVMTLLDRVDQAVRVVGAANTVQAAGKTIHGFNTDPAGVCNAFKNQHVDPKGKKALVLGAGGAARAAVYSLMDAGCRVTIINRTFENALHCGNEFHCSCDHWFNLRESLQSADLIVNALSAPALPFSGEWIPKGKVILDADYRNSPLASVAKERGCLYIPGEEWLLHQAAAAFESFTGIRPVKTDIAEAREAMNRNVQKKRCISLIGFMGSGKSTLAPLVAGILGFSSIDSDQYLEESEQMSIREMFTNRGEAWFREREKETVERLAGKEGTVIAWGGGVVLDADSRRILKERSHVIWLYSPREKLAERTRSGNRPLLQKKKGAPGAWKIFEHRKLFYGQTADMMICNENNPQEVANAIAQEIDPFLCD